MVFQELAPPQSHKHKNRRDLEDELFGSRSSVGASDTASSTGWAVRDNEGEAAEHGIYYDDTEYDYMQHLRDVGEGESAQGGMQSVWVEASNPANKDKGKGKHKQSLEDALRGLDLEHDRVKQELQGKLVDPEILPSMELKPRTYQDQQDVPDALAGFQPDMDPRLREVLEALEDDAYVDADEGDDFFTSIAEDKRELSLDEFEDQLFYGDDDEEGWESDRTARPDDEDSARRKFQEVDAFTSSASPAAVASTLTPPIDQPSADPQALAASDGTFMSSFRHLPKTLKQPTQPFSTSKPPASILSSTAAASSILPPGAKRKKRKGALTDTSSYSMTSSSLARTEGLTTLDARFDRILASYEEDDDDEDDEGGVDMSETASLASGASDLSAASKASGMSRASATPSNVSGSTWRTTTSTRSLAEMLGERKDLDSVMDEFLGGYSTQGKGGRRVRKGPQRTGVQELDEIRRELGRGRPRVATEGVRV